MLEKENNQCHCTENCGCKSHNEEHNKETTTCGCSDHHDLDKKMEFDNNSECCCDSDCTDESCGCCEEEACGCNEHACGCGEHHEHN